MHRTGALIHVILAGPQPLEVGRHFAIDRGPYGAGGSIGTRGPSRVAMRRMGPGKLLRRHRVQESVDVGEVGCDRAGRTPRGWPNRAPGRTTSTSRCPPAISNSSNARRRFSSGTPPVAIHTSGGRVSSWVHAWLSSSAPIQTSKLALIHEPRKDVVDGLGRDQPKASLTVTARMPPSSLMRSRARAGRGGRWRRNTPTRFRRRG